MALLGASVRVLDVVLQFVPFADRMTRSFLIVSRWFPSVVTFLPSACVLRSLLKMSSTAVLLGMLSVVCFVRSSLVTMSVCMGPFASIMRPGLFLCLKIGCVVGMETYMWSVRVSTTPPVRFGMEPRLRSRQGMRVLWY